MILSTGVSSLSHVTANCERDEELAARWSAPELRRVPQSVRVHSCHCLSHSSYCKTNMKRCLKSFMNLFKSARCNCDCSGCVTTEVEMNEKFQSVKLEEQFRGPANVQCNVCNSHAANCARVVTCHCRCCLGMPVGVRRQWRVEGDVLLRGSRRLQRCFCSTAIRRVSTVNIVDSNCTYQ